MAAGRNDFDVYQELAGRPPRGPSFKVAVVRIMATAAYQKAPMKDPQVDNQKGTKKVMFYGHGREVPGGSRT